VFSVQREVVPWVEGMGGYVMWDVELVGDSFANVFEFFGVRSGSPLYLFCVNVTEVALQGSPVIEVGDVKRLGRLPFLEGLDLAVATVGDEHLEPLMKLSRLNWLDLGTSGITDQGLETVAKMSGIRELGLSSTRVTDEGMRQVANLRSLVSLDITDTSVSDEGLKYLRELPNLNSLMVDQKVTDAGIDEILRHPTLVHLSFRNSPVTDAAMDRLMACLPDLKVVELFYTAVTGDKIKEMEARGIKVLKSD
ncbi:MAG: hypothetical protein KDM64_16050, partial [Verrucomicrobiae bacterium]|nr:hypothetical protein [Verrucomicrobiae bacterium]